MFNIQQQPPIYDPEAVQPMRDELTYCGFEELTTPEKVDEVLSTKNDETVLVMINSVCGCAAGSARPGVTQAVQHEVIPDRITTIFAGQDRDAAAHFRQTYLSQYPPSSPSIAIIKNGEVLFMMPRHHIEGRYPDEIAGDLIQAFDTYTKKKGPSISEEKYKKLVHAIECGSKIPLNEA
ncbi:MAG: BrxA/BrxB family bacilliredoxin [Ignavibacteriae bacterium HGW-Ignavibacteriae-2]|jgi:putative YphP/YqiW family bacilliredoxin|nr:MAG: BrxA/BrxB family bacilliredoxin [Ignavibacteriae bacterium HGW-Ignavibacteriae-2]